MSAPLPAQQQRPPVFRGEAVLVTVDAYPQIDGRIVPDLTAADFQILEDGKPQTIENIEFVRIEPSPGEAARRDPNSLSEMNALAADPRNRVFVVFLDALHVTVAGSHAIRRPLDRRARPHHRADGSLRRHDPEHVAAQPDARTPAHVRRRTTDAVLAMGRAPPARARSERPDGGHPEGLLLREARAASSPVVRQRQRAAATPVQLLIDRRHEDRTLTALEGLIDRLAGMREARTVVMMVSDGWRLFNRDRGLANEAGLYGAQMPPVGSAGGRVALGDPTGNTYSVSQCTTELIRLADIDGERRLRDLITRANRANVSFYPITPGGLATFDTPISEARPPDLAEDGARIRARLTGLRTLAENTDGLPIIETNDLGGGMRRIVDDVSAYYLLGYYSTNTKNDGRFRRIDVKVAKPGVNVRARRGYVAPSDSASRGASTTAAAAPAAPAGLDDALGPLARLRAGAEIFTRAVVEPDAMLVAVEIAGTRVLAAPWNAGADVRVTVAPADGTPLPPVTGRIDANSRGVLIAVPSSAGSHRRLARDDESLGGRRGGGGFNRGAREHRCHPRRRHPVSGPPRGVIAPARGRGPAIQAHGTRAHRMDPARGCGRAVGATAGPHGTTARDSRHRHGVHARWTARDRGRRQPRATQRRRLRRRIDRRPRDDDHGQAHRVSRDPLGGNHTVSVGKYVR